jgi:hypothetical protein
MNTFNQKLQKSLPLALAAACGAASLLAGTFGTFSTAMGSELTANHNSVINSQTIATASTCPKSAGGGKLEAYIETSNFSIYLCQRRGQIFYTSTSKNNNSKGIRSLKAYAEHGTGYVAKNGQYEYIVTGANLSIFRNGKLLQTDPVIKYVSGYSN